MQTILLLVLLAISTASHAATMPMIGQPILYLLPEPRLNLLVETTRPTAEPDLSEWLAPQKNCVQFAPNEHVSIRLELTNITRKGLDEIRLD